MVSAFRSDGVISTKFGAFDAYTVYTRAGSRRLSTISNAARPHSNRCRRKEGLSNVNNTLWRPLLAVMASTPVAPRNTSIDHELRAHFVIGLIV